MKKHTLSLTGTDAQEILAHLPEQFEEDTEIVVTRNDQPILTILPYKTHQEMLQNIASLEIVLEIMAGGPLPPKKPVERKETQRLSWEEFQSQVGWE